MLRQTVHAQPVERSLTLQLYEKSSKMRKNNGFSWVRLDVDFLQHPKFMFLSPNAICLWLALLTFSGKHSLDGVIPESVVHELCKRYVRRNASVVHELCTPCASLKPLLRYENGAYILNDYLDYQESKNSINARRERLREAGRKGGLANSGKHNAKHNAKHEANAVNKADTDTDTELIKEKTIKKEKTKTHAPKGACALPQDFMITDSMRQWATENLPPIDLDAATAEWADYWHSTGQKRKDWTATWRNGMRKYIEWGKHQKTQNLTPHDQRVAALINKAQAYDQQQGTSW